MAREQLGICAEANLHGCCLLFNALEGHEAVIKQKLARLPALFSRLSEHFSEAMLTGVIAIGSNYWDSLYPDFRPANLFSFPAVEQADFVFNTAPIDLCIHIRSDRLDVNYIVCQQVFQLLQPDVELLEKIETFRYLDGRDLTGFVETPDNPKGAGRRKIALIDASEQPLFAGGSYMYLQRFYHDLCRWQRLSVTQQENIIGCHKIDSQHLDAERFDRCSHRAMQRLGKADGAPVLLQQNMPFGLMTRQGILKVSYSAEPELFECFLRYSLGVSEDSPGHDLLLNYLQPELGAAFFAPSVSFLEQAAMLHSQS